ncbi:M1 family metallopeptidase [Litorimonas haliclonae]|uniref:M1 family metallopeptidase n=1 Tax=Litorimonas haliclonae TaxID=2081977 RepID=UPI0039EF76AE
MSTFKNAAFPLLASAFFLGSCGDSQAPQPETETPEIETFAERPVVETTDKFTYANYKDVRLTHIDLNLDVNFEEKVLDGVATLDFERIDPDVETLVLDTKDLTINSISLVNGETTTPVEDYTLGEADPVLGQELRIPLGEETEQVLIDYTTSPTAEGLQWLSPEQTAGKEDPYLFSQAQAINARTMAPLQDTPAVRLTYSATLRVPDGLRPLMSASQGEENEDGEYQFDMPQAIPSYLIAIAVGDIEFKAINDHIGVYAEDYILDASAEEFSETPMMEEANEELYGPYRWGRYDLIVLPPSFPFGGMENPRLSFMTPTLIAGDKSLTNVVAHELAHSWSGNLVTNATWRDAWLNEGFTSYVENRVMEKLYGERRAVMEQALALEDLKRDIAGAARPELTQLKLPADISHPDDAFSQVAYVKGQYFLIFLEERFGRAAFDPFLKSWFNDHAFESVTTEDFLNYMNENLRVDFPDAVTDAEIDAWVYEPGLPNTAKNPQSDAFETVQTHSDAWVAGELSTFELEEIAAEWSTHEWLHFLNGLPDDLASEQYEDLDKAFSLTGTQNAETAFAWYMLAIKTDYEAAYPDLEGFLMTVGRGKFIYRLYDALKENGKAEWAERVYAEARPGYHPIAQRRIDDILNEA